MTNSKIIIVFALYGISRFFFIKGSYRNRPTKAEDFSDLRKQIVYVRDLVTVASTILLLIFLIFNWKNI